MSEMCGWLVGLPAPAPACMCGVEGSRPQPLTQASALKETESGEARAALTIYITCVIHPRIATQSSDSSRLQSSHRLYHITLVPRCHSRISPSRLGGLHQRLFTLSRASPSHIPFLIIGCS